MKLSVIIPSHNEAQSLLITVPAIYQALKKAQIKHELLVINDNSTDDTQTVLKKLKKNIATLCWKTNQGPKGYGNAVQKGLENFRGDCVAIMMADLSDSPEDLVSFYNKIVQENVDCVFGSRFIKGGKVKNYPWLKLVLNRIFNNIVRLIFDRKYNDFTNAFKLYKREAIEGLKPFLSPHFNLTLELPLKAIVRGYSYAILPNSWANRAYGKSKLKIKEMGGRYFFILLYCLIEKYFAKGDYRKQLAKK